MDSNNNSKRKKNKRKKNKRKIKGKKIKIKNKIKIYLITFEVNIPFLSEAKEYYLRVLARQLLLNSDDGFQTLKSRFLPNISEVYAGDASAEDGLSGNQSC